MIKHTDHSLRIQGVAECTLMRSEARLRCFVSLDDGQMLSRRSCLWFLFLMRLPLYSSSLVFSVLCPLFQSPQTTMLPFIKRCCACCTSTKQCSLPDPTPDPGSFAALALDAPHKGPISLMFSLLSTGIDDVVMMLLILYHLDIMLLLWHLLAVVYVMSNHVHQSPSTCSFRPPCLCTASVALLELASIHPSLF